MKKEYSAIVERIDGNDKSVAVIKDFCGDEVCFVIPFTCEVGTVVKITFES